MAKLKQLTEEEKIDIRNRFDKILDCYDYLQEENSRHEGIVTLDTFCSKNDRGIQLSGIFDLNRISEAYDLCVWHEDTGSEYYPTCLYTKLRGYKIFCIVTKEQEEEYNKYLDEVEEKEYLEEYGISEDE